MISHRYRCVYFKVPKCASTALREWMFSHAGARDTIRPYWSGGLLSARMGAAARIPELYPEYFAFSFVRHPLARFVSLYNHACRLQERRSRELRTPPVRHGGPREFAELCRDLLRLGDLWGEDAQRFFRENREREFGPARIALGCLGFELCHARTQASFLPGLGAGGPFAAVPAPGFIGRVETLEEDIARLCRRLGMPADRLPRSNAARAGDLGAGGLGQDVRRVVAEIYAEDYALLGYATGEEGGTAVLLPVDRLRRGGDGQESVPVPPRRRTAAGLARARFAIASLLLRLAERLLWPPARRALHLRPVLALRRVQRRSGARRAQPGPKERDRGRCGGLAPGRDCGDA